MFNCLLYKNIIERSDINNIYVFADEHTTATNGRYELKESLEQEFKTGTLYMYYIYHNQYYSGIYN